MLFTLEALKGREGDCLLLHWGTNKKPRLAVIDGGPGNIYEASLRPRLEEIRVARGGGQLPIELVMVSHIDTDHITGVKKLFSRLAEEVRSADPDRPFRVNRLWHNTFDDIVGNELNAHYEKFTASFEAAAGGGPKADTVERIAKALVDREVETPEEAPHLAFDIALVLAGHGDGRRLRDDQAYLFTQNQMQRLNKPFGKTLITNELTRDPIDFLGLAIRIVGPLQEEIDALQAAFDEYLQKNDLATAEAALASYADKSIPNLSSIVCLIANDDKFILLTGDARGDRILEGLRKAALLGPEASAKLKVNILKVPHHGSDRNVALDFFKAISADHYVFSGDGKHGNPDRSTVDWVIRSRSKADQYDLVFTYPIAEIDKKRKSESSKWNEAKNSLQALIEQRRSDGYQFTISEGGPLAINLGDEALVV